MACLNFKVEISENLLADLEQDADGAPLPGSVDNPPDDAPTNNLEAGEVEHVYDDATEEMFEKIQNDTIKETEKDKNKEKETAQTEPIPKPPSTPA